MAKELIVCCDGTGNSKEASDLGGDFAATNVQATYDLLSKLDGAGAVNDPPSINPSEGWETKALTLSSGTKRIVYYDRGLGSPTLDSDGKIYQHKWSWWPNEWPQILKNNVQLFFSKFREAEAQIVATGIMQNVQQAYTFIVKNYEPGDRIYLFGFSRGSYTQLLLVTAIHYLGIVDKTKFDTPEKLNAIIQHGFDIYESFHSQETKSTEAVANFCLENSHPEYDVETGKPKQILTFLGLWDIVRGLVREEVYGDHYLPELVANARHAISIDERRRIFKPQLWIASDQTDSDQCWFPGVHCDVGGGYADRKLADIPFHWMLEAAKSSGLELDQKYLDDLKATLDPLANQHDSLNAPIRYFLKWGALSKDCKRQMCQTTCTESVAQSARDRFGAAVAKVVPGGEPEAYTYYPSNLAHQFNNHVTSMKAAIKQGAASIRYEDLKALERKLPDPDTLSDAGGDSSLIGVANNFSLRLARRI